ncbi:hypothetical protein BUALT_Bualt16G0057100 [Buddleja alternifolia]|uniref:Uncharacterized protein n=1 Tax=Buddleja alternifolia TaxID=168488 RepID=A0AAV6WH57_9LAMI|nr:hypothetical protein BUALT_Bualt16G0057100 [Buddleja alternifolia]
MMQKLTRKWRKSHKDVYGDDYSLPTRDDDRPIDTQEQEELVRSLEKTQAQQSLLWRSVFAGLVFCYVAFNIYSIYQQAYSPWELKNNSESYAITVVSQNWNQNLIFSILDPFSELAAVSVCLMVITGLMHNSRRHRLWIWYSFVPGTLLAIFWLHHMLRLANFRWDIIWLPLTPLGGAGICLYVDHLLDKSSEEVRKLRGYMYTYKAH